MTRTVRLICLPVHVLLVLLVASASQAQQRVTVSGTVTDPSGAVVPGALVEAVAGGRIAADGTTGQDGRYRLEMPAGQYELRARLQGFTGDEVAVNAATSVRRDLRLEVAAIGDTLVVTAARTAATRANAASSVSVFSATDLAAVGGDELHARVPAEHDVPSVGRPEREDPAVPGELDRLPPPVPLPRDGVDLAPSGDV